MKLAIVDIDGTLVRGASTERRFAWWLMRRGVLGPRQAAAFLCATLRGLPRHGVHTLRRNKAYLSGLDSRRLTALGEEFVAERIRPALFPPMIGRVKSHLAAGDPVVLVSGTLAFIAAPLAGLLGVQAISTLCAEREHRLTAEPPLLHPFGETKAQIARELCSDAGLALEQTIAYGDSAYDLPLLESVGTPVAVRPDRRLRRLARRRGWEILAESCAEPRPSRDLAQSRWRR